MAIRAKKSKKLGTRYSVRVHLGEGKYEVIGTYPSKAVAKEEEAKWILSKRSTGRKTGKEWADFYLEGYKEKNKDSSHDTCKSEIGRWCETFGTRTLTTITEVEAEEWARQNSWAVQAVVTMLNRAVKQKVIPSNPFSGLSSKGPGRKHNEPMKVADLDRLSAAAKKHRGVGMETFVIVAGYTGMRVGELFALQWPDIDFKCNRIAVKRRLYRGELDLPKSNKTREIVLLPEARDALLKLDRGTEWVFLGVNKTQLTQGMLSNYWQKIETTYGSPLQPHELKHFCGHHLYVTMGMPDRVVAVQLGHNDGGKLVRDLYGHGDVGALDEIERAYAQKPAEVVPIRGAASK